MNNQLLEYIQSNILKEANIDINFVYNNSKEKTNNGEIKYVSDLHFDLLYKPVDELDQFEELDGLQVKQGEVIYGVKYSLPSKNLDEKIIKFFIDDKIVIDEEWDYYKKEGCSWQYMKSIEQTDFLDLFKNTIDKLNSDISPLLTELHR